MNDAQKGAEGLASEIQQLDVFKSAASTPGDFELDVSPKCSTDRDAAFERAPIAQLRTFREEGFCEILAVIEVSRGDRVEARPKTKRKVDVRDSRGAQINCLARGLVRFQFTFFIDGDRCGRAEKHGRGQSDVQDHGNGDNPAPMLSGNSHAFVGALHRDFYRRRLRAPRVIGVTNSLPERIDRSRMH